MLRRKSSSFRFVSSSRTGQYSVWRGEMPIGYVTKVVHRIFDRGMTKTIVTGWMPSTANEDLALAKTREDAAIALWREHNR